MQNIFTISLYNKRHVENTSATHFHRASMQCINELCLSLLYGSRDDQIITTNTKITHSCASMQVEALTAVFNGALTNVQQRSGSGLWLRFHLATIKQKMAIKDHRKRNKIPSDMEVAPTQNCFHCLHCLDSLYCFYCLHSGLHA